MAWPTDQSGRVPHDHVAYSVHGIYLALYLAKYTSSYISEIESIKIVILDETDGFEGGRIFFKDGV